jgi:hypothetical protein
MSVAKPRYCAKGKKCVQASSLGGKPVKLAARSTDDLCGPCRERVRDAEIEAEANRTIKQVRVRSKGSPREARLKLLKQELVAQLFGKRGDFGEAVKKVRLYWWIDHLPMQRLPGPNEDILRPPILSTPTHLANLYAGWSHHPHLPPGPPTHELSVVRNLERQWQNDLLHALLCGGVPETYLDGPSPHAGYPPTSTRRLPWLQFAAACVLCDVPVLEAPRLAEVGAVPSLRGDVDGETILGVIGPQEQRERVAEVEAAGQEAYDKTFVRRLWELRSELGDDLGKAKREVMKRFGEELQKERDLAREDMERWLELNPPRHYLIEFDPEVDMPADIEETINAVLEECGIDPQAHGNLPQGDLLYIMIARLLEEPDWTVDLVAREFDLKTSTVTTYRKKGKKLLADET